MEYDQQYAPNDDFAACFIGFPHKRLSFSSMNGVNSNDSNQKIEYSFEGQSKSLYRIKISNNQECGQNSPYLANLRKISKGINTILIGISAPMAL